MAVGILPTVIKPGGGGGGGSITGSLDDLSDVILSSPTSGQVLAFGPGQYWRNKNLSSVPEFQILQAQVSSISTSAFTPITTTAALTGSLQSQISSEVINRQLGDQNLQQQINEVAAGSHVVFSEQLTGNGVATHYQLTGAVTNGQFISGGWAAINVLTSLESNITDVNGKPVYDAGILSLFTRHRIYINSIDITGGVNLDYAPQNGQTFKLWYWYDLQPTDRINNYYRDDFVAKMEQNDGDLATNIVANVVNFNNILSNTDNTVQKALETLDDHTHPEIPILSASVVSLTTAVTSLSAQVAYVDAHVVHLAGNENISGSKNFTNIPTVSGFNVLHYGNAWFEYYQATPSTLWTINHNLDRHPSVTTTNTSGIVIVGSVTYINNDIVAVKFTPARSGYAYLN
jgi:hypothetical protein